jgi:hypothetical protein
MKLEIFIFQNKSNRELTGVGRSRNTELYTWLRDRRISESHFVFEKFQKVDIPICKTIAIIYEHFNKILIFFLLLNTVARDKHEAYQGQIQKTLAPEKLKWT